MSPNTLRSDIPGEVPDPDQLGQSGWNILHTAAAAYPNKPSDVQKKGMLMFIEGWSQVYACSHCAYHMRQELKKRPPVVTNKREISRYICNLHNTVNRELQKEEYDCDPDVVLRRWHPTYPEMEDSPTIEEQLEELKRQEKQKDNGSGLSGEKGSTGGGGWFTGWFGGTKQSTSESNHTQVSSPGGDGVAQSRWSPNSGLSQSELASYGSNDKPYMSDTKGYGALSSGWSGRVDTSGVPPLQPGDGKSEMDRLMAKVKACSVYCPEKKGSIAGVTNQDQ
eukprot:Tbor_TRINITY_DN3974_c0_g1::TRINITY_DN3974_c0_g1_i1::g.850::m.850/K17783/ERV1, GFER, ALR; mitochondrial FAD-linked sulfhydryl oxidase